MSRMDETYWKQRLIKRFWSRVNKQGPTQPHMETNCWIFFASFDKYGYGYLKVKKKMAYAHRLSWTLTFGPIPNGLYVLHKCDNPPCVRPDHLSLGTLVDNNRDSLLKKRHCYGERNGRSKLTEKDVQIIRRLAEHGVPTPCIYHLFPSVSKTQIHTVINHRQWRHI